MSKSRSVASIILAASLCVVSVAACSSSGGGNTAKNSGTDTAGVTAGAGGTAASGNSAKELVYFIFTGYTPPYFAPMAKGVQEANKHFPSLNIKILSSNGSSSTEISQIKQAQAAGARGIILNPDDESVTSAAKQASSKIPIVTIDRDVSDPSARIAFIGDNDTKLGAQLAGSCIDGLKASGLPEPWHIIDLQGTPGSSTAVDREAGIHSVLKKQGSAVKVVLNQSGNFATDTAQTTVSEYLAKSTNVQAIFAANDAMALGALQALKSHGVDAGSKTLVCGADAQPEDLAAVKAGTQYATVSHSPYVEAFWAVEAMDQYLAKKTEPPRSNFPHGDILVPQTVVTKANVDSIGPWGTPATVPPLPYGTSHSYPSK